MYKKMRTYSTVYDHSMSHLFLEAETTKPSISSFCSRLKDSSARKAPARKARSLRVFGRRTCRSSKASAPPTALREEASSSCLSHFISHLFFIFQHFAYVFIIRF